MVKFGFYRAPQACDHRLGAKEHRANEGHAQHVRFSRTVTDQGLLSRL
jgi:hypothetical protein